MGVATITCLRPAGLLRPDADKPAGQEGFLFNRFGVRVPCVVVNPRIPKGLIARASGHTPFDHTSVIKTVQKCFGLKGHLTARDRAAPDFSGLLSATKVRGKDIPDVSPLKWKSSDCIEHENDLHRIMLDVIEVHTGKRPTGDQSVLEFIQEHYCALFSKK